MCSVCPVAAGTDAHKPGAPGLWSRKPRRGLGGHTPSGAPAQGSSCLFQLWGLVAMSPQSPEFPVFTCSHLQRPCFHIRPHTWVLGQSLSLTLGVPTEPQ